METECQSQNEELWEGRGDRRVIIASRDRVLSGFCKKFTPVS